MSEIHKAEIRHCKLGLSDVDYNITENKSKNIGGKIAVRGLALEYVNKPSKHGLAI